MCVCACVCLWLCVSVCVDGGRAGYNVKPSLHIMMMNMMVMIEEDK